MKALVKGLTAFSIISVLFVSLFVIGGVLKTEPVYAQHTATVTISPNIANCNSLGNTFTVNITNDASSNNRLLQVEIDKSTAGLSNFICGPAPPPIGWTLLPFSDRCIYVTELNSSYKIAPGSSRNFTFQATMSSNACAAPFVIATVDDATPRGFLNTYDVNVKIDCTNPTLTKTVGNPNVKCTTGDCDYWITQNTILGLSASDNTNNCDLGIDYCRWRYTLDGGTPNPWNNVSDGPTLNWNIQFQQDSSHYLEIECYDKAGNKVVKTETDKVDTTPPATTKVYGSPSYPTVINANTPYPHYINTSTPITLNAPDGGAICHIDGVKTYYFDKVVDDSFCQNEQNCVPDCGLPSDGIKTLDAVLSPCNWQLYTGAFKKTEDSCHILQFYSVDAIGNIEPMKHQCVFVDSKPPVGAKVVGDPKIQIPDDLEQLNAGTAAWSTVEKNTGSNSAKLVLPNNAVGTDFAGVDRLIDPVGLDKITSLSYYRKVTQYTNGWNPIVILGIDANGNGVFDAKPLEWEASLTAGPVNPALLGGDSFIQCEAQTGLSGLDANFVKVDAYTNFACYTPNVAGTDYNMVYMPLSYFQANNTERVHTNSKVDFLKIELGGNPSSMNNEIAYVDTAEINGNVLIDEPSSWWVTKNTQITMTCTDPQPHPVDNTQVCYRITVDSATPGSYTCVNSPKTINFAEDSNHQLDYYCKDALGNKGPIDSEKFKVDTTPPAITKTMLGTAGVDYLGACPPHSASDNCYVADNGRGGVHVAVADGGAVCAVDQTTCDFKVWWDTDTSTCSLNQGQWDTVNKCLIDSGAFGGTGTNMTFKHDSTHRLVINCQDALGNAMPTDTETFLVDSTPPVVTKTYGVPTVVSGSYKWITSSTPIYLNATDNKVGVDKIAWRVTQQPGLDYPNCTEACANQGSGQWSFSPSNTTFNIPQDSCHLIEFYGIDKLGNSGSQVMNLQTLLKSATLNKDGSPVPGSLDYGYQFTTNGDVSKLYVLTLSSVVADSIVSGDYAFKLKTATPQLAAYFQGKAGWSQAWKDWAAGAVAGTNPFFYLRVGSGPTYQLVDAFMKDVYTPSAITDLRINGDYPTGVYTYEGTVGGKIVDVTLIIGPDGQLPTVLLPHKQCVFVDNTAPATNKTIGTPMVNKSGTIYINQQTHITLTCNDTNPHPVRREVIWYRYQVDGGTWKPNTTVGSNGWNDTAVAPSGVVKTFTFPEDSQHTLEYYCVDALGNKEITKSEIDIVETMPPVITTAIEGPSAGTCPATEGHQCFLDGITNITVTATDPQPHPVEGVNCSWDYTVIGGTKNGTGQTNLAPPFKVHFPEESNHTLTITCKDALGNTATKTEYYSVDKTPPVTIKSFSGPQYPADSELAVALGTDSNFAILAKSGISTTGNTSIVGDIGVSPAAASYITGFGLVLDGSGTFATSSLVTGKVYAADYAPPTPNKMTTAISDMEAAYTDLAGRTPVNYTDLYAGIIGGKVLTPGIYKWSTGVTIPTDVTISGGANDVWIFQIAGTLDISSAKKVILSGAQAKNIYWVVAGQTTLGTTSVFNGNILDQTAIVINTGAKLNGRALAQTAVTLQGNNVVLPAVSLPVNASLPVVPRWITSGTNVALTAYDVGPHKSGINGTYYRETLLESNDPCYNETICQQTTGTEEFVPYIGPFEIPEESCHLIEYYSVDNVGKTETVKKQCVFVDNTPPVTNKTVSEPKNVWDGKDAVFYNIADQCWSTDPQKAIECWKITLFTPITLNCVDSQPHPVENNVVCFKVGLDGDDKTAQYCSDHQADYNISGDGFCCLSKEKAPVTFRFNEESEHNLAYYCKDALGNVGTTDDEKFKVEGSSFTIDINKKWNLISTPFVLQNNATPQIFDSHSNEIISVWGYDAFTDKWHIYPPDGIANDDLDTLTPGSGYWVLASNDTTLLIGGSLFSPGKTPPSKTTVKGWNLLGYYGTEGQTSYTGPLATGNTVACELDSISDSVLDKGPISVFSYWETLNPKQWYTHHTNTPGLNKADKMDPGAGYWVFASEDGIYAPSTTCVNNAVV